MNNKYKKAISEIEISKEQERKILSLTTNKKRSGIRLPKLVYQLMMVGLLGMCTLGTIYAKDVASFITTVLSDSGKTIHSIDKMEAVEIKEDAPIAKQDADGISTAIEMSVEDAEEALGIDILTSDMATSDILYYSTGLSGKKIGRVDLWHAGFIDDTNLDKAIDAKIAAGVSEEEYQALEAQRRGVGLSVSFFTKDADNGYLSAFEEGLDAGGGKIIEKTYHIDSLNVDAVIYTYDWSETRIVAAFVYNNILYSLYSTNITQAEMIKILDSLK